MTGIVFKEFLPDLPVLNNPGLIEANNVLPDVGCYRPYSPLAILNPGSGTLPAASRGLFSTFDNNGVYRFYAASSSLLFLQSLTTGAFVTMSASLTTTTPFDWCFAQYENLVFACNHDNTMYHTIGAATNFLTAGAPSAAVVGVVGQFVVVGDLRESSDRPNVVRWSAIDDPTNWPTPNSATAIAAQAGEQALNAAFGAVQSIIGGDQFAVILQETGITRMTYVGPPAVFQFDEIERSRGAAYKLGAIKAGAQTHFFANDGFYATDGVSVVPTGLGKIDKTFVEDNSPNTILRGVFSQQNKCVLWSGGDAVTTGSNRVYAFHTEAKSWSRANEHIRNLDLSHSSAVFGPYAFDENNVLCRFVGTAGSAVLATGDYEFNPGGRAFLSAVKANVESSATAPAIGMRIGTRDDLGTAPAYTSTTAAFARTGFANFRSDAKYHRVEVNITGNFDKVSGVEVEARAAGKA